MVFHKTQVAIRFRAKKPSPETKFCVGMPVVGTDGQAVGVRSPDCQIFTDGQFTTFFQYSCL